MQISAQAIRYQCQDAIVFQFREISHSVDLEQKLNVANERARQLQVDLEVSHHE